MPHHLLKALHSASWQELQSWKEVWARLIHPSLDTHPVLARCLQFIFSLVMLLSICMVRPPVRVIRCKSPSFLGHSMEERPPLVRLTHGSESIASSVRLTVQLNNNNGCACKENHFLWFFVSLFFVSLYHVGHFNADFKCSYTLDYIATLSRSPIYALSCVVAFAVRAMQCNVKLRCLF